MRWMPVFIVIGVSILSACTPAGQPAPVAQNATAAAAHGAAHAAPTPPAPRTALLGNLGTYHRSITTQNEEAQKFFDEGLTLLYGFNHEEAFRSFERAAALDPQAPMPHWGMSLALGTNYNDTATPDRVQQAHAHLTHASERARNGSDVERAFIDALAKRYVATANDGKQAAREEVYSAAMREVSTRFPDDLDAATLAAESMMNLRPWKLYAADGKPAPGTDQIVAMIESVLKRNPEHPGANHYYIHAVEASHAPERAVTSAKRLETLVPGAGHLVHMPAHIYQRTGDYRAAAKSNAVAADIDEKYLRATGATGMYPTMYYGHNLQFLSAAAMMAGNFAEARDSGRKTAALVAPLAGDVIMLQPFAQQEVVALLRFERWDDVLAAPAPPAGRDLQLALDHYARGAAHAALGHAAEAEKAAAALDEAAARIPKDAMVSLVNSVAVVVNVARADLTARVALAEKDVPAAVAAWTRAVAAEDALAYNEPPDWLLPTRERLGAALMRAGRAAEAEKVFRADLARNRQNPRSLFGLWKALERQGKSGAAAEARKNFESAWQGADVQLSDSEFRVAS
jgi:tetratricopeptide (TPR) repeat protein